MGAGRLARQASTASVLREGGSLMTAGNVLRAESRSRDGENKTEFDLTIIENEDEVGEGKDEHGESVRYDGRD